MNFLLKLEEFAQLVLGIFLFSQTDIAWWWFLVLILTPDIGMLGYLVNSKVGAIIYNLFHHKGIAVLLILLGYFYLGDYVYLSGVILFSHAAMDRIFGYGLKYNLGFSHTHLGIIGKNKS